MKNFRKQLKKHKMKIIERRTFFWDPKFQKKSPEYSPDHAKIMFLVANA